MDFKLLYGNDVDIESVEKRIAKLKQWFFENEKMHSEYIFSSSGRAEILGNHTDHNHGKVIVSAISCDILAAVGLRDDKIIKICSEGYKDIEVNIEDTKINASEYGQSAALTRGVVAGLIDKGYTFNGFTAYTTSSVFKGAGVSSSAAFELLITEIINDLYLENKVDKVEKALISQKSENEYFGKPCGALDQMGISFGSLTTIDLQNPNKPIYEELPILEGYTFVITNAGGDHSNLTPYYASIKSDMREIAEFFGKKYLREVEYNEFFINLHTLKSNYSERAILRAFHFFDENKRVDIASNALQNKDYKCFLQMIDQSGESSLNCLQNCYVPGESVQPVALALKISKNIIKDGACRVHGGGFAGTILAVVSNLELKNYISVMQNVFGKENVFKANIRKLGATKIY